MKTKEWQKKWGRPENIYHMKVDKERVVPNYKTEL